MTVGVESPIILMAEDDSDDRLLTADALADGQVAVDLRFVSDGVELMDYLNHQGKFSEPAYAPRPGLIILDLNMPRKDGCEALREIKADPELRDIPVVILSTSRAEPDVIRAYELGANSFISKPVAFNALVTVMKTLVEYWFRAVILPGKNFKRT